MEDGRDLDTSESHLISSTRTPDLKLHLRSRDAGNGRPVLFVHGATFSSRLFDIPHAGVNWLAAAAAAGLSPYALDIRGYGRSKPAELSVDAPPYATGDEAICDIADAVDWITARHGGAAIALVGWSWGSITTARYITELRSDKVAALVLYAPIFAERNAEWLGMLADPADPARISTLRAFRRVDLAATRTRWDAQIPAGAGDWRQEAVLQALVAASLEDDPASDATDPPSFRVPNGAFVDLWESFNAREPYDPFRLTCPVMLVRGAQDPTSTRTDALALFDRLSATRRQYVEIANGTHFINAEAQAGRLFTSVHGFLRDV
ncbi:alpha/beta fold hydrolase [uncultured Paracoccus sp.]|uniref:alpha/beta hydrolase n=1 Tax=uncultured Paracoccus sp. TaxID=189685 RepID=UPI00260C68D9|nr:alpha/beta fold hydrolase [uncultured Paracoccus sp.]